MRRQHILALGMVVLSFSGMATFADMASFQSLGCFELAVGTPLATREAWGISADDTIAGGGSARIYRVFSGEALRVWQDSPAIAAAGASVFVEEAFRWTAEAGVVGLDYVTGHIPDVAHDDWSGGPAVAEDGGNGRAFLWTALREKIGLGDLRRDDLAGVGYGVSGDGSAVMGYGSTVAAHEAQIWDQINDFRNIEVVRLSEHNPGPRGL